MPNPFPGMNPYLEAERFARGLQLALSCRTADVFNTVLGPAYFATNASRSWKGEEEQERNEHFAQIFHLSQQQTPVCIIEFLSRRSKIERREEYLELQQERLNSSSHMVEVDLLRDGPTTVAGAISTIGWPRNTHYVVSLHRAGGGGQFEIWPANVRHRLPRVPVPLRPKDGHVTLDVGALINTQYDSGRFHRRLDYAREPLPPFQGEDAAWLDARLREAGLRN